MSNHLRPLFATGRAVFRANREGERVKSTARGSSQDVDDDNDDEDDTAVGLIQSLSIRKLTPDESFELGLKLVGFDENRNGSRDVMMRRFRAFFGIGPKAFCSMYNDLSSRDRMEASNLFMALNWLRIYDNEHVLAGRWMLDEKTIRTRVRKTVTAIQGLKDIKIKWEEYDDDEMWVVSVDGVHCRIQEVRKDPGAKWYDHKTNSAGLSYEVALGIRSGRIVWMKGPFPASRHDITTFRGVNDDGEALIDKIPAGMKGIGDSGYRGEPGKMSTTQPGDDPDVKKLKGRIKARQETLFHRMKSFDILENRFRHGVVFHKQCFEAVAVSVQYDFDNGSPLFQV